MAQPLVAHNGERLTLNAETLSWLAALREPLVVLSAVGPMRSGKSTLLNSLFGGGGGGGGGDGGDGDGELVHRGKDAEQEGQFCGLPGPPRASPE